MGAYRPFGLALESGFEQGGGALAARDVHNPAHNLGF